MTNEEQMQVLKEAIKSNYKGRLAELLQPQPQPQGPEGVDMQQQMPEMPVPPTSPPRINPASAQPPVQDNQRHLVQSYQSAPPGLRNLPSGPAEGMLIQKMETGGTKDPNPREYSIENVEQPTGEDEEAVVSKRTFDAFKNLDVVKDSYKVDRFYDYSDANPEEYVEYDGKLVDKAQLERYLTEDYGDSKMDGKPLRQYLLDSMLDYRNLDREDFIGKDVISRYEDFKDKQNTDYRYENQRQSDYAPLYKAMDKILPKLDTLTDAEVQEFTRLINTLSSPYTEAMSKNEDFGATDALKILANQDLSGIKKYREKMGLSKEDVLDLIQPPEDANKLVKGLTNLTKKTLKYFVDFKHGGYKPKYPQKFQEGGNDKVTPLDMDYVTYGTKEYNKAYKQGKVATTSYDDQGDVTFHAQMLPEVEIESERGPGPSTLESAAYAQEVNPVIRGVQQSGREKVALATLGLPTAGIIGAELGIGYGGQQLVRSGYTNILKPTAQKLIAPMKRYGTKAATDFTNLMSKSPAGQSLMQTAKSKAGSLFSGTYNTMKGMAVPQVYQTLGKQVIAESKGEGNIDNRLQAIKKTTDIVPQLAIVKDTFKIGKDLYDKDYDSAALRTLALAGDKNPLFKYGTKLFN